MDVLVISGDNRVFIRQGECSRCGECCKPDPSERCNPLFSAEELAEPDRVEGYCPMFRWSEDGLGTCTGHGWHPFYTGGCYRHPTQPHDMVPTPSCSYNFIEV